MNKHELTSSLHGSKLIIAAFFLSLSNFIVVLDMTVANVSVSHIAGSLAISITEGTYVITSYAVAEAISVPLTGWLASRFGTLRTFITCIMLFGVFSAFCGFATNLETLIIGRVFQGLVGGPLMPLTQTLLLQIFPKAKRSAGLTLWAMTTLLAPVTGPMVGGYICDNWAWGFIFLINIPIAISCSFVNFKLLRKFETTIIKNKIDFIGLFLLILWVSSLQIMLDEGKNYDWFESKEIWALAISAVIGIACFIIWELTHDQPIVDLRVFRHRGYTASVFTLSLAFGSYFASNVLTPLWLQNYMGYTSTWSGRTTSAIGVLAVFAAPLAAKFSTKYDSRILVFFGLTWLGLVTCFRSFGTSDMAYEQIMFPLLIQGIGAPFFFVPLTALALANVKSNEVASAAGLMSFLRTLSGAISTSIVTTAWDDKANILRNDIAGRIKSPEQVAMMLGDVSEVGVDTALYLADQTLQNQTIMLSTNHIFLIVSLTFALSALAIWLVPKTTRKVDAPAH